MRYFQFILIFIIPVVFLRKILRSNSTDSLAEILNSSVSDLDDFTLCGRVLSHQFSSLSQMFLYFPTDKQTKYSIGLGTWPGYPCDKTNYEG